jgi:predicted dehydrogenase
MNKLKMGVIGYGFMGKMHASIYNELHQTELVAICDVNPKQFENATLPGVQVYTDFREMIDCSDIDAVSICVSDRDHFGPTFHAAQAGKHIFLEKPIAIDLDEAHKIVQVAEDKKVKLMIGFLLRFDPRYAGVKDLLDQGKLGEIIHIHARRNSPKSEGPARYKGTTPLIFHVTIHDLDLILWYIKQNPVSVYAQTTSKALKYMKMDDSLFAIIRFQDDTIVNLESSWALPEGSATKLDAYMEILGTQGMARVECGYSGLWFSDATNTAFPDTMHWPSVQGQVMGDLKEELSQFADNVIRDTTPRATGMDGVKSLELAWAIQKSIDTNQIISL